MDDVEVSAGGSATFGRPPRDGALVVAVDGPSGSGKSTVSREVARRLGLRYLDTGAMYRAVTWQVLRDDVDVTDAAAVSSVAARTRLDVGTDPDRPTISANGRAVDGVIRGADVSRAVSAVSAVPAVRQRLVALQQALIGDGGIVVEGRDIGTVVAPDAAVKVYLTASGEARAVRRSRDLAAADQVALVRADLDRRDQLDTTRPTSPLAKAVDAVELDSTSMSVGEVVDAVLALCADVLSTRCP